MHFFKELYELGGVFIHRINNSKKMLMLIAFGIILSILATEAVRLVVNL